VMSTLNDVPSPNWHSLSRHILPNISPTDVVTGLTSDCAGYWQWTLDHGWSNTT
jgi:hypothetical protein